MDTDWPFPDPEDAEAITLERISVMLGGAAMAIKVKSVGKPVMIQPSTTWEHCSFVAKMHARTALSAQPRILRIVHGADLRRVSAAEQGRDQPPRSPLPLLFQGLTPTERSEHSDHHLR